MIKQSFEEGMNPIIEHRFEKRFEELTQEWKRNCKKERKEPGFFSICWEYIKAKKQKVCPLIEYDYSEEK